MARWTAGAKWAAGLATDDQRDTPLGLSLSEGLGRARWCFELLMLLANAETKHNGTVPANAAACERNSESPSTAWWKGTILLTAACFIAVLFSGCVLN